MPQNGSIILERTTLFTTEPLQKLCGSTKNKTYLQRQRKSYSEKSAALAPAVFNRKNKCHLSVKKKNQSTFERIGSRGRRISFDKNSDLQRRQDSISKTKIYRQWPAFTEKLPLRGINKKKRHKKYCHYRFTNVRELNASQN